jgi:hypothetical protein
MKKALLVGINQYQLAGAQLAGCVNDVNGMAKLLSGAYGYQDVRILTDGQATRANILAELECLTSGIGKHDRLVFHYSGHGTQVPDRSGDEEDGADEAICPVDITYQGENLIIDDELATFFNRVPSGARLTFISDSCHSGTVDRALPFTGAAVHSRFLPLEGHGRNTSVHIRPRSPRLSYSKIPGHWVLVSGCRDDQTSADAYFGNVPNGALTYSLLQVLGKTPRMTYRQLVEQSRKWLGENGFDQVPQLTASANSVGSLAFA